MLHRKQAHWPVEGNVIFSDNWGRSVVELDRSLRRFHDEYLSANQLRTQLWTSATER